MNLKERIFLKKIVLGVVPRLSVEKDLAERPEVDTHNFIAMCHYTQQNDGEHNNTKCNHTQYNETEHIVSA
jgi:hypothetical protein